MHYNAPIIYGNERDHTKVYDKERHCFNCHNCNDGCNMALEAPSMFGFRDGYQPARQTVYWGRCLAEVCGNFKLKGVDWDR